MCSSLVEHDEAQWIEGIIRPRLTAHLAIVAIEVWSYISVTTRIQKVFKSQ